MSVACFSVLLLLQTKGIGGHPSQEHKTKEEGEVAEEAVNVSLEAIDLIMDA